MLRPREANQADPQAGLFLVAENPTAILDRTSRDKAGRVKVSSVVPTGPRAMAMLMAKGLCLDPVRQLAETAVSQLLAVMATQDKAKATASSH